MCRKDGASKNFNEQEAEENFMHTKRFALLREGYSKQKKSGRRDLLMDLSVSVPTNEDGDFPEVRFFCCKLLTGRVSTSVWLV